MSEMREEQRAQAQGLLHVSLETDSMRNAKYESWVEGPRWITGKLDAGIQAHGLTILYWRVHKVGWFTVRVVYGVQGPSDRIVAFKRAVDRWAASQEDA